MAPRAAVVRGAVPILASGKLFEDTWPTREDQQPGREQSRTMLPAMMRIR